MVTLRDVLGGLEKGWEGLGEFATAYGRPELHEAREQRAHLEAEAEKRRAQQQAQFEEQMALKEEQFGLQQRQYEEEMERAMQRAKLQARANVAGQIMLMPRDKTTAEQRLSATEWLSSEEGKEFIPAGISPELPRDLQAKYTVIDARTDLNDMQKKGEKAIARKRWLSVQRQAEEDKFNLYHFGAKGQVMKLDKRTNKVYALGGIGIGEGTKFNTPEFRLKAMKRGLTALDMNRGEEDAFDIDKNPVITIGWKQIMDAEGKPMVDAQGNPVLISPEEQLHKLAKSQGFTIKLGEPEIEKGWPLPFRGYLPEHKYTYKYPIKNYKDTKHADPETAATGAPATATAGLAGTIQGYEENTVFEWQGKVYVKDSKSPSGVRLATKEDLERIQK